MKQFKTTLLGWALILLPILSIAQSSNRTVVENDKIFSAIDKKKCRTNILYNRVSPLANLIYTNYKDSVINKHLFQQAYFEVYNASYDNLKSYKGISTGFFDSAINAYAISNTILVGVLQAEFNYIDSNYLSSEYFTTNDSKKIWLKPSNYHLPAKSVYLASILQDKPLKGDIKIFFPKYLQLGNKEDKISSINITVANKNYQVLLGEEIIVNLPAIEKIPVLIETVFENGKIIQSKSIIRGISSTNISQRTSVYFPPQGCFTHSFKSDSLNYNSDCIFQGYDETQPYCGKITASYYYRQSVLCGYNNIQNPVILLDGFDPSCVRTPDSIYLNFFNYPTSSGSKNMCDQLTAQGFDVIVIDMPFYYEGTKTDQFGNSIPRVVFGGSDYIERNGLNLVAYLRWLNTQIPAGQTISLVGPSMGGQISRYALNYMEKRGEQHNVRLWISMDSPHKGANVAIGAQTIIDDLAQQSAEAAIKRDIALNSPAAKQQIIHHYLSGSEIPQGAPGFFDRYYAAQNAMGWPTQCRKVAMVSGSVDGVPESNGNGGNALLDLGWNIDIRAWGNGPGITIPIAQFQIWNAPNFGNRSLTSRFWNRKDGTVEHYAEGFSKANKSIDWIPGGQFDFLSDLAKSIQKPKLDFWTRLLLVYLDVALDVDVYTDNTSLNPKTCFIPTYSAIAGYENNGIKWDNDLTPYMYRCQTISPFDYFMGPKGKNYRHDELFEAQAGEIIDEINGVAHQFPKPNAAFLAPHHDPLFPWCVGQIKNFSITGNPIGKPVNWILNDPIHFAIVSGQGTASIGLQYLGNATGNMPTTSLLMAEVYTDCQDYRGEFVDIATTAFGDYIPRIFGPAPRSTWDLQRPIITTTRSGVAQVWIGQDGSHDKNGNIIFSPYINPNSFNYQWQSSTMPLIAWQQLVDRNGLTYLGVNGPTHSRGNSQHNFRVTYSHLCTGTTTENFTVVLMPGEYFRFVGTSIVGSTAIFTAASEQNIKPILPVENYKVEWFDLAGKLLATSTAHAVANTIQTQLPALPKGIVLAKIIGKTVTGTQKVFIP